MNYAYYITITLQYTAWKKQRGENWALTEIWNYFQHAVAYVGHKTASSFLSNSHNRLV